MNWVQKQLSTLEELSTERQENVQMIDALFKDYLSEATLYNGSYVKSFRDPEYVEAMSRKVWDNSVLVICTVRLGMKGVEPEYLGVIRDFFHSKLNVGILGGRPGEAYFLIGLQEQSLIFLDPHTTVNAISPE